MICVPIMVQDLHSALDDAHEAQDLGADLVEFRLDEAFEGSADGEGLRLAIALCDQSPLACIVTCRPVWEGGGYDGDDADRVALFERLGTGRRPPRYLDVELEAYTRSANLRQKIGLVVAHDAQLRAVSTGLILSLHDFDGRPPDLTRRLLAMREHEAAAVHKIAYRVRTIRDNLELFEILADRDRPTIALGMGEMGLLSRVLAPKFGGLLTFASLRQGEGTAPGQPTIRALLETYRFRSIGPRTSVLGVIGWPASHSIGPRVHNAVFDKTARDAVYLPLPIPTVEGDASASDIVFKATLLDLLGDPRLDFLGASVTIPHKERLHELAKSQGWSIDDWAQACGAANTVINKGGAVRVSNTDAPACAEIMAGLLDGVKRDATTILIFGAGGVARASAVAGLRLGARVVISSRSASRSRGLADALRDVGPGEVLVAGDADLAGLSPDVIVNATPVGMSGGPDPTGSPVADGLLEMIARSGGAVFDTVYKPIETPLVRHARGIGLRVVTGDELFVRQAALQHIEWFGDAPASEMLAGETARALRGAD